MNGLGLLCVTVLHEYYITGILITAEPCCNIHGMLSPVCDSSLLVHVLFMAEGVSFTASFQEPKAQFYCQLSITSCHYCLHQQQPTFAVHVHAHMQKNSQQWGEQEEDHMVLTGQC